MAYERLNLKTGQVITEEVFAHLEDGIEGAANAVLMTPILYADLVALRDAGKLKAGMFYRITDYVTTTVQENTQSAGHAFDVIVMATDSQTLSEEARAIVHEGDTYFTEAGANLAAWKVWYALDNDSTRFAWADAENGKGVIYRLIDEWNNDCPYDFKNIMFVKGPSFKAYLANYGSLYLNTYEKTGVSTELSNVIYHQYKRTSYVSGPPPLAEVVWITSGELSVDTELYTIDETSAMSKLDYNIAAVDNTEWIAYTFSHLENDASLLNSVRKNQICRYVVNSICELNRIVFRSVTSPLQCRSNTFGDGCYSNTFGDICYGNTFGDSCYGNTFGDGCRNNACQTTEGTPSAYVRNNFVGINCDEVILQNDATASFSQQIQNYRIANGMTGTVEVTRGLAYETTIAKATDGTIKQFNMADLAN